MQCLKYPKKGNNSKIIEIFFSQNFTKYFSQGVGGGGGGGGGGWGVRVDVNEELNFFVKIKKKKKIGGGGVRLWGVGLVGWVG